MGVTPTAKRLALLKLSLGVPLAVFVDLDGTLFQSQWLIELMLAVAKRFRAKRELVEPMRRALETYKKHRTYDYAPVITEAVKIVPTFFVGLSQREVRKIARRLVRQMIGQTYLFPRMLIHHYSARPLKERGLIVAITGAPADIAEIFCAEMGFDLVYAVKYEVDRGCYTGVRDDRSVLKKGEVVDEVKAIFNLDLSRSVALGDTKSDLPMLTRVRYGFAVNPDRALLDGVVKTTHPSRIKWVNDRQKNGVSFFVWNGLAFEQYRQTDAVPDFLRLPELPGPAYST